MPRTARETSHTGVYHAILRGVNKQQIFECSEDYNKFLQILRLQTQQQEDALGNTIAPRCAIYAYCQMGNHVHLLLKETSETIAEVMKPFDRLRINSKVTNDNILYIHPQTVQ